jgi:hypothetical protein
MITHKCYFGHSWTKWEDYITKIMNPLKDDDFLIHKRIKRECKKCGLIETKLLNQ